MNCAESITAHEFELEQAEPSQHGERRGIGAQDAGSKPHPLKTCALGQQLLGLTQPAFRSREKANVGGRQGLLQPRCPG